MPRPDGRKATGNRLALGVTAACDYNPFYAVADNLASCWLARGEMNGDFIQVNGDNVFRSDLVERLLAAPKDPVAWPST